MRPTCAEGKRSRSGWTFSSWPHAGQRSGGWMRVLDPKARRNSQRWHTAYSGGSTQWVFRSLRLPKRENAPVHNGEMPDWLEAFGALLELGDANPYTARAYRRAAETIRG